MLFIGRQHLIPGQLLTRRDIAALLGGNSRTFLPQAEGRVVAGCFDPAMNPRVPTEVLVGASRNASLAAKRLIAQGDAVPFFVKRATAQWEYLGDFRAVRFTSNKRQVGQRIYEIMPRIYERYRKSYGDIRGILFLEEC
jgi:hypothetical protein